MGTRASNAPGAKLCVNGGISDNEIRHQISKILASPEFARATRLGSFLRFIVGEAMEGRGEQLKEVIIGAAVYHKNAGYDPKSDSTVRVEAAKLRLRLQVYYQSTGQAEPFRLEIPKGRYVPQWRRTAHVRRTPKMLLISCLAVAIVAAGWWMGGRGKKRGTSSLPDLMQQQLTTNSTEIPVNTGAISPDGRHLAYADKAGVHVKFIDTDETRTIPAPPGIYSGRACWSTLVWFPDSANLLATAACRDHNSIWLFSAAGGTPRHIRDDAIALWVSPSGSTIAFAANANREIWLMDADGANPRVLARLEDGSTVFMSDGFSNGERLRYLRLHDMYNRAEFILESRDLKGGPPSVLYRETSATVSGARLIAFSSAGPGRIILSLRERGADNSSLTAGCNLWEMGIRGVNGVPSGQLRRLTNWPRGFILGDLSSTADGGRLAFVRHASQGRVYVADLKPGGSRLTVPRLLTLTDGWNAPVAWMPDSKAVLFTSNRNGRYGLWRQVPAEETAQPLIDGKEEAHFPVVSVDGAWVVYVAGPPPNNLASVRGASRLMRIPIAGGPSRELFTARIYGLPRCAKTSGGLCVIAELGPDRKQIIFSAFDPVRGRGPEIGRCGIDSNTAYTWDLSPDSTRIALVNLEKNPIQIINLRTRERRDLNVKGWNRFGDYVDWASDGNGLFLSGNKQGTHWLLHVDLHGNSQVLWDHPIPNFTRGVPSPDGRHLAILDRGYNRNFWMLENF